MNAGLIARAFGGTLPSGTGHLPAGSPSSPGSGDAVGGMWWPASTPVCRLSQRIPASSFGGRVLGKFVRTIYAGALVSLTAAHSGPAAACRGLNQGTPVRQHSGGQGSCFAEGKRFELLVRGYRTLVFKTSSFGRSDNLPQLVVFHRQLPATKQRLRASGADWLQAGVQRETGVVHESRLHFGTGRP